MLTPEQAGRVAGALSGTPTEVPDLEVPDRIGSYRIRRLIGAGGMGMVYEAEQEHPRRTVAIKVLNRGIASPSALRRFELEAEMLGHLQHPGIAQVYEAGTHDDGGGANGGGVPYFVMEYIPGARSLVEYADAAGLSTRQRLEMFARVCDAVHHGHQKGIIHRDLKPANILVGTDGLLPSPISGVGTGDGGEGSSASQGGPTTESPIPKIIDFGVARSTDSDLAVTTIQTEVGRLIGTLQYMSPEQCEGDPRNIDTRSDVYSLGVVLFELICGRLPYDISSSSIAHAARTIQDEQPTRPSTIVRKLRGDIEIITLKALEKDREKRYQSAAELAAEIRRYLAGQPIEAKPPTAWTTAIRWGLQHPILTTTAACMATATLAVIATFAMVAYLWSQPYRIELADDGREARLLSRADNILRTWKSSVEAGITFAELVERCPELGGGDLAIIGYSADDLQNRGRVCAYDISDRDEEPVWSRTVEREFIPHELITSGRDRLIYGAHFFRLLDVFHESPGVELVVMHQQEAYSACCVRIYNLQGTPLYQVWHDGNIRSAYWMADAELLVLAGLNGQCQWPERGVPEVTSGFHPRVLFAVQPQFGALGREWPIPPDVAWYSCLLPPSAADLVRISHLAPPPYSHAAGSHVAVAVCANDDPRLGFSLIVDAEGLQVGKSIVANAYRDAEELPDASGLYLGELPPVKTSETTE